MGRLMSFLRVGLGWCFEHLDARCCYPRSCFFSMFIFQMIPGLTWPPMRYLLLSLDNYLAILVVMGKIISERENAN